MILQQDQSVSIIRLAIEGSSAVLLVFSVPFVIFGGILCVITTQIAIKHAHSYVWSAANGQILKVDNKIQLSGTEHAYTVAIVKYTYNVVGSSLQGVFVENRAKRFSSYAVGGPVLVYYDTNSPSNSTLQQGLTLDDYLGILFCLGFNTVIFIYIRKVFLVKRRLNDCASQNSPAETALIVSGAGTGNAPTVSVTISKDDRTTAVP